MVVFTEAELHVNPRYKFVSLPDAFVLFATLLTQTGGKQEANICRCRLGDRALFEMFQGLFFLLLLMDHIMNLAFEAGGIVEY